MHNRCPQIAEYIHVGAARADTDTQRQLARPWTANSSWPDHGQPTLDGQTTGSLHQMARTRTASTR